MLQESIVVKEKLLETQTDNIAKAAEMVTASLKKDGKVLIFGNGGSAADAQHIAAEFIGRFKVERRALPAIALTTNTSILTAIANDYGYEHVFSRQIEALGQRGDVAICISTSGNSLNVVEGMKKARTQGLKTIALTGKGGGRMKAANILIAVPSSDTPLIQQAHITIGHIICQLSEDALAKS